MIPLGMSALMSLMLLLLLGSLLRSGVAGVPEWFAANLALVIALPLLLLRGKVPDVISIVAANMLMAGSGVMYYAGYARFLRRPVDWPVMAGGLAAVSAALIYWRYAVDSIPVRVLVTTLFTAAMSGAVALLVLRNRPTGRSAYPYWLTSVMALIFGASEAGRGVYFMMLSGASSPSMFVTTGSVVFLVIASAFMPAMSMCAMMMVHETLLGDARDSANRDFLTGALSRQGFETIARTRFAEGRRTGLPASLLIIDLDGFKSINDAFGHAGGDQILREFVQIAGTHLRRGDVLGRIGGEEFAVLLPETEPGDALRVAERLRKAVAAQTVMTDAGPCRYSISGGIAGWQAGETFDRLSMRADNALYSAKDAGRDRMCVHQATDSPDALRA
jgi:diguanylate cyclase (GGDEF)-like protein